MFLNPIRPGLTAFADGSLIAVNERLFLFMVNFLDAAAFPLLVAPDEENRYEPGPRETSETEMLALRDSRVPQGMFMLEFQQKKMAIEMNQPIDIGRKNFMRERARQPIVNLWPLGNDPCSGVLESSGVARIQKLAYDIVLQSHASFPHASQPLVFARANSSILLPLG